MQDRMFMAAFTMMIMLSATLSGCINDDNSKISDTLIEVPFTGPVDERGSVSILTTRKGVG